MPDSVNWIHEMRNEDNNDDLKPLTSKAHTAAETTTNTTIINNNRDRHLQVKIHKIQTTKIIITTKVTFNISAGEKGR